MRFLFNLLFLCLFTLPAFSQTQLNVELQSHIDFGDGGSGIWGHTDANGIEYAVIGTRNTIKVLSLEDPKNPIERLTIPGSNTTWREARSWGNFIYVTTESNDGVTIIDATNAPTSFEWKRWKPAVPQANGDTLRRVHSIYIDTVGYLYLNGHNVNPRGVIICDLNQDAYNPTIVANMNTVYTHDCFANADLLYTCDLNNGVGIYDIKDRSNPIFLNRFYTTSTFVHNAWTSDDGKYLYTTDETSGAFLDSYDVSDPKNVVLLDKYRNEDTQVGRVIPHNVYTVGNYAVTSWYTDGFLITDMTRPFNIVKVGEHDTYTDDANLPGQGSWFIGCWGVYPYFKSGLVIASDINSGLWVFKPEYKRACYLEGHVYLKNEEGTLFPLTGGKVSIMGPRKAFDISNQDGIYRTGIFEPAIYQVEMNHPDFPAQIVELELKTAEVNFHDFIIETVSLKGSVVDEEGKPITDAKVVILNKDTQSTIEANVDELGSFSLPARADVEYSILATAWSYRAKAVEVVNQFNVEIILEKGYQDDFFADLGWKNTAKAASGNWERVVPISTQFGGNLANPGDDIPNDLGNVAYVTGNGGGGASNNDVDNGITVLESPLMNFEGQDTAHFSYSRWFFNGGGTGTPNDYLKVKLSNGDQTIDLETIEESGSEWKTSHVVVHKGDIEFTSNMKAIFEVEDTSPGHLVEGGLDGFEVLLSKALVSSKDELFTDITIVPNVSNSFVQLINKTAIVDVANVIDIYGKQVMSIGLGIGGNKLDISRLAAGLYSIHLKNHDIKGLRFIKL